MKVNSTHFRTIWPVENQPKVQIIDQTKLPFEFEIVVLSELTDAVTAIRDMQVRGAPLIGATAAYGMALACVKDASDDNVRKAAELLNAARPTAVNLQWATAKLVEELLCVPQSSRLELAFSVANQLCDADVAACEAIGDAGQKIIESIYEEKQAPVNVLTHCNAGWLATVDWGTALAPIYKADASGVPVHVWVDETRPRNQGALLTAWECAHQGISHTVIVDNAGGHLMQHGQVDLCIVGTDRTAVSGDVCNKIGTYLKALAAFDNEVPFYVAAPSSSIDFTIRDGIRDIPIEQRNGDEVARIGGVLSDGTVCQIRAVHSDSPVRNDAFDVTPAKYVSGLITERGVCDANEDAIRGLFPERALI